MIHLCGNYEGLKLSNQTINIVETVWHGKIREEVDIVVLQLDLFQVRGQLMQYLHL